MENYAKDLEEMTLMDDWLMKKVLEDNKEAMEDIIRVVLGFKVTVKEIKVQKDEQGTNPEEKNTIFDVVAIDDKGNYYNVEIQNYKKSDIKLRSRYYSSKLDMMMLKKGETYRDLKNKYVIFFCSFDAFKEGKCIYTFIRKEKYKDSVTLNDGDTIVFVNLKSDHFENDEIKALCNDLKTKNPNDLTFKSLSNRMRKIKGEEDSNHMLGYTIEREANKALARGLAQGREEGRAEGLEKGREERNISIALFMISKSYSNEEISEITGLSIEKIEELRRR